MGRFVSAEDPDDPAGTSDEEAALMDERGNSVSNGARSTWVSEQGGDQMTDIALDRDAKGAGASTGLVYSRVACVSSSRRRRAPATSGR